MEGLVKAFCTVATFILVGVIAQGQYSLAAQQQKAGRSSSSAMQTPAEVNTRPEYSPPSSPQYQAVQKHLAVGWNTWDVNSVITQVLLPEGLAIHIGLKHNSTIGGSRFLPSALIDGRPLWAQVNGKLAPYIGSELVFPGPHAWDGRYTDLRLSWHGHDLRIQSAHDGDNLVLLATPIASEAKYALPPTIVFSVNFLWNHPGTTYRDLDHIEARGPVRSVPVYCTCSNAPRSARNQSGKNVQDFKGTNVPIEGPYFAADLTSPVGISTGKAHSLAEIQAIIALQERAYKDSIAAAGSNAAIVDAVQTTLGWDTIYEPDGHRVITPVSRAWSVVWGGYVIFDWDNFFAATLASVGDRDLAYANAVETLREETPQGFVPNYAGGGGWKSWDRSEPPVGSITVLGLYQKFHDRWFLQETFEPLLRWNRWWSEHRSIQGYLTWGSDGENKPVNLDDQSVGKRGGAIYESGLDNSPMYDGATYDSQTHRLEFADVGLMGMYIADCEALAKIADALDRPTEASELRSRATQYRTTLATLWNEKSGIFLNKDLRTNKFSLRLSPTNFYPMLAGAATPAQASRMIQEHLLNPQEFWGQWVIPSIARNDPAFTDQDYWRGRIWGPMNYLVYLGLRNYDDPAVCREFAQKSYKLFLQEWHGKGHVHENYNAITGAGDDVTHSDPFYHWGALLPYIEYLQETQPPCQTRQRP